MIGRKKIKKEDAGALLISEVVCKGCLLVFSFTDEKDMFWLKSDEKPPWVFCNFCYPTADDVMKDDNLPKPKKKGTGMFDDLFAD